MLTRRKVWLSGKLIPFDKAQVHVLSHSFCRGSAVFEVMSVHKTAQGPAIFRLDDHIERLFKSAKLVRMKLPMSRAAFKKAVKDTVRANKVGAGIVKLICYYGAVEFEVIPRNPEVSVLVAAVDIARDLGAARFKKAEQPARATVSKWRKIDPRTVPIECKCAANYLGGMIAKLEAMDKGFSAPILLDVNGYLAEGATESLFIVKNGVLKTPKLGNVLAGITRKTVLEIARDINVDVQEKQMRVRELYEADEAFFTSSVVKTWPICKVEDRELPAPGQITRLLDNVIGKILTAKIKPYKKWLAIVK